MKRKPIYNLTLYIVCSAILICLIGFVIKITVGRRSVQLKDSPAIAVPFAVINDQTILGSTASGIVAPGGITDGLIHELPKREPAAVEDDADPGHDAAPDEEAPPEKKEFHEVEESYFDDALFIGDSRTVGLSQFGRLGNADYFAGVGLSCFNILKSTASDTNFGSTDLPSLLSSKSYGKIYIMLGINEVGYPKDSLYPQLSYVVSTVRDYQPDALIFVMANLRVSQSMATSNTVFSLDNINAMNDYLKSLTDGVTSFYLDANPQFCDENGYLNSDLTGDGCHLYGSCYTDWAEFIRKNGI